MIIKTETNLRNFETWSGATETKNLILDAGLEEEFEGLIEELYPNGLSDTERKKYSAEVTDDGLVSYSTWSEANSSNNSNIATEADKLEFAKAEAANNIIIPEISNILLILFKIIPPFILICPFS